jgi:proteasome lid subunit RPN8/RPN11
MPNVHEEGHERRYLISPDAMFRLDREARAAGLQILGFYHSHPDHPAQPSEYDREWAWPWYSYIIISVLKGVPGVMTCWTLKDDRMAFEIEERLP